jgi:glycosyltransferase involved in cell wall biosynthesis
MLKNIHLLRTYYSHWSKYSGINRFIEYVNSEKYKIDTQVVPRGSNHFPFTNELICRYAVKTIKKNGVIIYTLNDLMAEVKGLSQWLKGHVDILHYLDGEHSLQYLPTLISKLSFRKNKTPIIANFHQPPDKLAPIINIDIIRRLDRVIVLCPEQQSYFEQYISKDKIALIPHGIDTEYFQPITQAKRQNKFKCLTVGFWLRDYETVLTVAKKLENYSDIEFHIVSSKVKLTPKSKNIHLYQNIDDAALLKLYQNSNVLFLPLLASTANNVLLEALACGLPIVSTQLPSVATYVPGEEAILIEDNNPEIFMETLLNLYQQPQKCQKMSKLARKRAMELSWTNIAQQYENLYSQLVVH